MATIRRGTGSTSSTTATSRTRPNRYNYGYDNLNQISAQTHSGTPGRKTDVAGTVADDEGVESVTVTNATPDPDDVYPAQVRKTLFIARGVELQSGVNNLYAVAEDLGGNTRRYPADPQTFHTVTLGDPADLTYVFDANGCLTQIMDGQTVVKEYIYDYEKRLIQAKHGGATVAACQYDGLGRRVLSDVGGVQTRYVYDGDGVVQEYVWTGSAWVLDGEYVHGLGTDNVLAITRDGETYYYHKDGLGSVTELTDATGTLVQAYEYDAWGIPTIYVPNSAIENTYLFTGREWDAALGLYYYRARHYDPRLGRFLQTDPAGYGDSMNLYVYAIGCPTIYVDPSGLFGWKDLETIADAIVFGPAVTCSSAFSRGLENASFETSPADESRGTGLVQEKERPALDPPPRVRDLYPGLVVEADYAVSTAEKYGGALGSLDDALELVGIHDLYGPLHREAARIQAENDDPLSQAGFGIGKFGVDTGLGAGVASAAGPLLQPVLRAVGPAASVGAGRRSVVPGLPGRPERGHGR